MSELPVLDAAILDDLIEHIGEEAARSVVGLFLDESRELSAAMVGGSPDATRRAAHSLKSSAGQLGALALAEAARTVEQAATAEAADLPALIRALAACAEQTREALEARLAGRQ